MGLIMVIGIVAKNGILLLDADERFRAEGVSAADAMMHAAQRRLRPIVMTAIAAVSGMLPLAFALGAGSQMLQPLAIAVIGGLAISMLLSLIVTPGRLLPPHPQPPRESSLNLGDQEPLQAFALRTPPNHNRSGAPPSPRLCFCG